MSGTKEDGGTTGVFELIIRKVLENIESPFVWAPLGVSIICIVAYPIVKVQAFIYMAIAFLVIAFGADWIGRVANRKTKNEPNPDTSDYKKDLVDYFNAVQRKAISMMEAGKYDAARALSAKNFAAIDNAMKHFPDDPAFLTVLGYTAKDIYQTSKGKVPPAQRKAMLARAHVAFSDALKADPKDPGAHNGLGNALFFEGLFDDAIEEHKLAIKLNKGSYSSAEHDLEIVEKVKRGDLPFQP